MISHGFCPITAGVDVQWQALQQFVFFNSCSSFQHRSNRTQRAVPSGYSMQISFPAEEVTLSSESKHMSGMPMTSTYLWYTRHISLVLWRIHFFDNFVKQYCFNCWIVEVLPVNLPETGDSIYVFGVQCLSISSLVKSKRCCYFNLHVCFQVPIITLFGLSFSFLLHL